MTAAEHDDPGFIQHADYCHLQHGMGGMCNCGASDRAEHEHDWKRQRSVTSKGYELPTLEVCRVAGCDAARPAETTTTEDAVGALLERMTDAATQLEALRDEQWYPPERQRLHGKVEGVKLATSYVEEARDLLATARTRPTRQQIARAIDDEDTTPCDVCDDDWCYYCRADALRKADAVLALLDGGEQR